MELVGRGDRQVRQQHRHPGAFAGAHRRGAHDSAREGGAVARHSTLRENGAHREQHGRARGLAQECPRAHDARMGARRCAQRAPPDHAETRGDPPPSRCNQPAGPPSRRVSHRCTLAPLRRHNRPHGRGTFRGRMDRGRSRFRTRIGTCMRSQTSTIASPKSQAPSLRAWRSDLCTRSPAPAPWHCRAGARPAAEPRVPAQVRDIAAHQHAEPQARLRARDGRGTPHAAAGCFAVPTFVGITLFSSTVSVNARFLCRRTSRRCLRAPSSLSSASRSRSRSTRCPGAFARGCTTMQTRTRSREGCAAVRRRLQVAVAKVRKG